MSWLYTIIFAGLMLSSDDGTPITHEHALQNQVPAIYQTRDETEKFDQTYPLNPNGRLSISNVNGSIVVEAWDRNEVKLEYTKIADTKERLSLLEVKIDSKPDYLRVQTDYSNWNEKIGDHWRNGAKLQVEYRLMVPRGAVLSNVETVNGSVTVSNFTNSTRASAVNGSVNATNLRGTVRLSTVSGEVLANFDRLENGNKISLDTVNGRVNLVIPSDSNATLRAESLNGNITNDFGLPVRKGKYIGRNLHGRLGNGDVQIRLESVNGGLNVIHKNDGRTLSPATNLLQKENDDEDGDNDNNNDELSTKTANKINKDVSKATKETAKSPAKIAAPVHKSSSANIAPEITRITSESIERAAAAIDHTAQILNSADYKERIKEAMTKQKPVLTGIVDIVYLPRMEKKTDSITVKGTPRVTVDAKGCSVKVTGWDKQEVQYVVTSYSRTRNNLPVEVKEIHSESEVNVRVLKNNSWGFPAPVPAPSARSLPDNVKSVDVNGKKAIVVLKDGTVEKFDLTDAIENSKFEKMYAGRTRPLLNRVMPFPEELSDPSRVHVEVFVPKKSNVKIVTDDEIRLEGVSGDLDVTGSDESINVRDSEGSLRVVSSDGRIRVIGFKGAVDARTTDGMISLEGDFQKLIARGGSGSVYLTLPENTQASLQTNCACAELEGEGISVVRTGGNERLSKYRIGNNNGSTQYEVMTEGEIRIRGISTLK